MFGFQLNFDSYIDIIDSSFLVACSNVFFGNSSGCCSISLKCSSDRRTPPEIVLICRDCDCVSQSILSPVGGLQTYLATVSDPIPCYFECS